MRLIIFPAFFILVCMSGIAINYSKSPVQQVKLKNMPDNVKAAIDKSCFGCHNSESTNKKSRDALNFDTFDELGRVRKITKLRDIAETVNKGEMPPAEFLEKYPDKKPTEEEVKSIISWSKSEIDAVIKN